MKEAARCFSFIKYDKTAAKVYVNRKKGRSLKTPPFCAFMQVNVAILIVFVIEFLPFGE